MVNNCRNVVERMFVNSNNCVCVKGISVDQLVFSRYVQGFHVYVFSIKLCYEPQRGPTIEIYSKYEMNTG